MTVDQGNESGRQMAEALAKSHASAKWNIADRILSNLIQSASDNLDRYHRGALVQQLIADGKRKPKQSLADAVKSTFHQR